MKFFKQLLVAPAALGLLAPMAAGATEVNVAGVSDYASVSEGAVSVEQVTSITQFSDVYPTDWAYQALSNLIERYGCVAGYPNGTYRGNRAMTRFEAAALLNACLDRVTEVTDELKRLMKEFEKELAIVKGRVDGLEARVGELEAMQFSTTTKLEGQTSFVLGANAFGGELNEYDLFGLNDRFELGLTATEINDFLADPDDGLFENTPFSDAAVSELLFSGDNAQYYEGRRFGATTFNYDTQINLNTSFTGKDLLTTTLRAGNFGSTAFFGAPSTLSTLEVASDSLDGGSSSDAIYIDKIFYTAPIGSSFSFVVGANVGQDDMMPMWPSVYPSGDGNTVLDVLTLNGAPAAYNKTQGPGAALNYENDGFVAGVQYVSQNGMFGNPQEGGIATDGSAGVGTVQIGYQAEQWGIAGVYSYLQEAQLVPYSTAFTQLSYLANDATINSSLNAFALSGYWQPEETGWIPAISAGWGINTLSDSDGAADFIVTTSQSWQVSLHWDDAFLQGNSLGVAIGQPTFATALKGGDTPYDGNYVMEAYYGFQVTDNITVTPAVFYLSRPLGELTYLGRDGKDGTFNQFGGVLRTTFTF
ncbi:Carbohydrate-selective porin, OprB family [Synechococcus sp. MIT S9509]|uniref:iron uptake porin n=1 Tax=Synechococcus sp. MIT S9509 TaxID=1801630 RepID=UPI0007BB94E0|nr:iron uptake porin [Synechococcus sp. MIT S9509]KZR93318.1 Carbohydrate-selective porin, OprB family [Synechococcus sp. MIT S9509]